MNKHIFTILPNVEYNEHTKLPPTKEFCKLVHETLKAINETTKSVSFITSRRITADLAEYVLNCDGHYKLDVTRHPTLLTALARPEFAVARVCEFVLLTGENPLEADDDAAWQKFCMRAVCDLEPKFNVFGAFEGLLNDSWRVSRSMWVAVKQLFTS